MLNRARAANTAEELLPCEWECHITGIKGDHNPICPANFRPAVAAELRKAYAEIDRLRAELASIEQFAETWPCHCAENYPGATMYHGQDCQTAIAVEFVAQWRAAKVKP